MGIQENSPVTFSYNVGGYKRTIVIRQDYGYTIEITRYSPDGSDLQTFLVGNMSRELMIETIRLSSDYRHIAVEFENKLGRIP